MSSSVDETVARLHRQDMLEAAMTHQRLAAQCNAPAGRDHHLKEAMRCVREVAKIDAALTPTPR